MKLLLGSLVSVYGLNAEVISLATSGSARVKFDDGRPSRTVPRSVCKRQRRPTVRAVGEVVTVTIDSNVLSGVVVEAGDRKNRGTVRITTEGAYFGLVVPNRPRTKVARELGVAYTMEEYHHWHRKGIDDPNDVNPPPHEDNKVCLAPAADARYREIHAARQAAGESTLGDRPSSRAEQAAGGYRFGRRGMMGVGRG